MDELNEMLGLTDDASERWRREDMCACGLLALSACPNGECKVITLEPIDWNLHDQFTK